MSERKKVLTGSPWESTVGYSRGIRVGDQIEIAGTTSMKNGLVIGEGDAYQQTVCILKIIEETLQNLGSTINDVVRTRMFVTDISKWEEIGKAHGEIFKDIQPVATMVEVNALIDPRLLVEIEAEAIVGNE
ncbi:RidA family protein [Bacillus sp. SM2101]|uniref:RidA family protein n=1 Tax=Bacillus sp. SM2101 TaxID=2805366 RepID=UPI001BDE0C0F|nr:RidA family protein [Bacillus sp. SM2101]